MRMILQWGIQTYNLTYNDNRPNPYKSLTIFFEPNSIIKYIGSNGIAYRENVNIYTCEKIKPLIEIDTFTKVTNLNIYSPASFVFKNTRSITKSFSSQCKINVTFQQRCSNKRNAYLFLYMVLLSNER